MIWDIFKSLAVFPVFLVLWLILGLSLLMALLMYDGPLVREYFGILVMVVLVVPIVVLVLYREASDNRRNARRALGMADRVSVNHPSVGVGLAGA